MALFGDFLNQIVDFAKGIGGTRVVRGGPGVPSEEFVIPRGGGAPAGLPRAQEFLRPVVKTPVSQAAPGTFQQTTRAVGEPSPIRPFVTQDKPPFPEELVPSTVGAAESFGLDPNLLASLIANESGGVDLPEFGPAGEVGLTQIIPELFSQEAGFDTPGLYAQALQNPDFAINEGARILSDLIQRFNGDVFAALASYNAGIQGFTESGFGREYAEAALNRIGEFDMALRGMGGF